MRLPLHFVLFGFYSLFYNLTFYSDSLGFLSLKRAYWSEVFPELVVDSGEPSKRELLIPVGSLLPSARPPNEPFDPVARLAAARAERPTYVPFPFRHSLGVLFCC